MSNDYADDHNGENIGGQWFDIDYQQKIEEEQYYHIQEIKKDRERRLKKLSGKYVIACKGFKSNKITFLQDREISNKGYWTQFLSNAIGFKTLEQAKINLKLFKYGNPCVYIVNSDGQYSKIN